MKGSHQIKKLYGVQEEGMGVEEEFVSNLTRNQLHKRKYKKYFHL